MGRKAKPIPPAVKLAQLALHAMPRLTRVTKLSFVCGELLEVSDRACAADIPLIVPEVIRIIGTRLRTLNIQSPLVVHLQVTPRATRIPRDILCRSLQTLLHIKSSQRHA